MSDPILFEEQVVLDVIARLEEATINAADIEVEASAAERALTGATVAAAFSGGVFWVRYDGSDSQSTAGIVLKFLVEIGSGSYARTLRMARVAQAALVKYRTQGSSIDFESEVVLPEGVIKQIYTVSRPSVFTRDFASILTT